MNDAVSLIQISCLDGPMEDCSIEGPPAGDPLPLAGTVVERRDATRNRRRVLAAAQGLLSQSGVGAVDIRAVAQAVARRVASLDDGARQRQGVAGEWPFDGAVFHRVIQARDLDEGYPVSYTHLTLPTICSV